MNKATPTQQTAPSPTGPSPTGPSPTGPRMRDPRLDFYRGLGMFIIFMAHMPGNWFTLYIPARFGFSDATEIFVFCSGMASAIAFGKIFDNQGWPMGAVRIGYRIWQVYWAHICLFFTILLLVVLENRAAASGNFCFFEGSRLCPNPDGSPNFNYLTNLNIIHMFQTIKGGAAPLGTTAMDNFVGIMTLSWVPNLFDILPMYIVILALIPIVMGLYKLAGKYAAMGFVVLIWLLAQDGIAQMLGYETGLNLPAEPWSHRGWFFNPFAWQLVFFTGFSFMMGWLPKPPVRKSLVIAGIIIILIYIPFSFWGIYRFSDNFLFTQDDARWLFGVDNLALLIREPYAEKFATWEPWTIFHVFRVNFHEFMEKSDVGILRYMHFLVVAYVFWVFAGRGGENLKAKNPVGRWFVKIVHKVGQQSLATFMAGLVFSRFAGFMLDMFGKSWPKMILINLIGMAAMVGVAYLVSWLKKSPWKQAQA